MKPTKPFDLLILGGGIAGLTAAIFAARANMKTAVIEEKACGGLANWTNTIENFPSYVSINGMELMERVLTQVEALGVEVDQAAEVVGLDIIGDGKSVETDEHLYSGKAIIIATGRQPLGLRIHTGSERIHYCSVCDGSAYAGKKVLVVGGGNSGFDESLYLLSLGVAEILLVESEENCCACDSTQLKLRSFQNVEIRTSTCVTAIESEANGCRVSLDNRQHTTRENVYVDGIFVFIGQKPNTEMFHGLLEMDDSRYIITDSDQRTNIPGVFAAGDITSKKYRYLTTAMSDGTIAALSAEHYIRSKAQSAGAQ
jgi:thioredoxin reductase (NADPH)